MKVKSKTDTKAAEAVIIGTNAAGTKTPDVKKHNTRKKTAASKKAKKKDRPKKNAPLKGDKDQSSVFIPVSDITAPTTHESVTPITHEAIARTDFQIPHGIKQHWIIFFMERFIALNAEENVNVWLNIRGNTVGCAPAQKVKLAE